jgi:hypothetical protein
MVRHRELPLVAVFSVLVLPVLAKCQTSHTTPNKFPLWMFDQLTEYPSCRSKGRLQDKYYCRSRLVDQVVATGKPAIPILISQLTDSRATSGPIFDYWRKTTAGDIAFFMLNSLFTESDWKTFTMPGLESLTYQCSEDAETCWRRFIASRGRQYVQTKWMAAWTVNRDRVYWDNDARCFRVRAPAK